MDIIPSKIEIEFTDERITSSAGSIFLAAMAKCPEVPLVTQYDPRWAGEPYDDWCYINNDTDVKATCDRNADGTLKPGYTQFKIRNKGCALTSATMVMNMYGYGSHGQLNPSTLDDLMNSTVGYDKGNFSFDTLKNLTDPDLFVYKRNLNKGETSIPKSELDGWLEMCIPVIVWVNQPRPCR
jgi:hypothetical protein